MSELYALVDPYGGVDRVEASIDPRTGTKPGWKWVLVNDVPPPAHDNSRVVTGSTWTFNGSTVSREWISRARTEAEIKEEADDARRAKIDLIDIEARLTALEEAAQLRRSA